jgi:hypothetical protein
MDWLGWAGFGLAIIVFLVDQLRVRSANRRAEEADRRADKRESEAAAREEEAALATTPWIIHHELAPVVEGHDVKRAPVLIRPKGINLWVHEVRLSWRPVGATEWVRENAVCPSLGANLPVQLFSNGAGLTLDWPGPQPKEQEQLDYRVRVQYSVSERGATRWRLSEGGSLSWQ